MCLIPEVPFSLQKLKEHVGMILQKKGHAVVCVAEGAGQVRHTGKPRYNSAAPFMCDSMDYLDVKVHEAARVAPAVVR